MTMTRRLAIVGAGLAVAGGLVMGASAPASTEANWKGGDSLMLVGLQLDPECGDPLERNFRAHLVGTGIDSVAGAFAVRAKACFNLKTLKVKNLVATDTFTAGSGRGSTITIESDDFTFEHNKASGVIYSARSVKFRVTGATGSLKNSSGHGHYEIALSWPPPDLENGRPGGLPLPAHVWFEGVLRR